MKAALAAVALIAVALGVAGCGGVGVSGASSTIGNQLTIYSSLPLQGPSGPNSQQIVDGEKLALSEAGGRIGPFKISYLSMDDSNAKSGEWDPGITATNAKTAAEDTSTIAYLGDYNSGASAVSLPLINASGILQISPSSPYVGLTSSLDAGQDEPERFYPSGKRTFGRLQPGDPAQAEAQVKLMEGLGVKRLYVLDDEGPFEVPLSEIVAGDAAAGRDRGGRARQPRHDPHERDHELQERGLEGRRKRRAGRVLRGRHGDRHGGAVEAAAQRRSEAAAARFQRHGQQRIHLRNRRRSGCEHVSDDADPPRRPVSAPGRPGARALPPASSAAKAARMRSMATRR